jgi:hypothetical protein
MVARRVCAQVCIVRTGDGLTLLPQSTWSRRCVSRWRRSGPAPGSAPYFWAPSCCLGWRSMPCFSIWCSPPPSSCARGEPHGNRPQASTRPRLCSPRQCSTIPFRCRWPWWMTPIALVRRSSKYIHKAATKLAVWLGWTAPDPGLCPMVEPCRRQPGGVCDVILIGEGLARIRVAPQQAPPALDQVEPG